MTRVAQDADEVSRNIALVTRVAQETSQSAAELLGVATDLSRRAEALQSATQQFVRAVRA